MVVAARAAAVAARAAAVVAAARVVAARAVGKVVVAMEEAARVMPTCSALHPPPSLGRGATPSDNDSCTSSGWVKAGTPAENARTNMEERRQDRRGPPPRANLNKAAFKPAGRKEGTPASFFGDDKTLSSYLGRFISSAQTWGTHDCFTNAAI